MNDAEGTFHFDIDLVYVNTDQLVCRASLPHIAIGDRLQISDFGIFRPLCSRLQAATNSPAHGRPCHRTKIFQRDPIVGTAQGLTRRHKKAF